jgi:hypothetical protein
MSHESTLELLNDALAEACTSDGRRVRLDFRAGEGEVVHFTAMLFDPPDELLDMRSWELPGSPVPAGTSEARLAGFLAGLRVASRSLDWDFVYPDSFPPFGLLAASWLASEDFVGVLGSPDALGEALARLLTEGFAARHGLGPISRADAMRLHELDTFAVRQPMLAAHVDALAGAAAPVPAYLLALLERWADEIDARGEDGALTDGGQPLRPHLATWAVSKLLQSLDEPDRARVARLRERGLIGRAPLDLEALFTAHEYAGVRLSQVEVGVIDIPAGMVIVCDPYELEVRPILTGAPPGRYPVRLLLAELDPWGRRVAVARLDLSTTRATRWRSTGHRFFVDAGLACFMSIGSRDALRASLAAFRTTHPDRNHYIDVLDPVLRASAGPGRSSGSWGVLALGGAHQAAVFASGLGDGAYEVLAGVDDEGRTVALAVDFGVLPEVERA